ncbi:MAG: NAD-dependent epimerase/dehydratase family protein [Bacteroidetes bacterium]|nr:NAD-dependent epimerase/dehydratase family protein [Bacteroidota bacterium]MBP6426178.1 NAD-dependent epimerase/dehydratase family protein [Bacteroidia bacterium]MBK8364834.1 NAD-dependent epimerase/dehydratase family protein [Bacteroidota bacterium]MBK9414206.1 NAD-dependent epimerase/dehydratase family protein [Bacteroidota bacterium]MBL0030761.1 NAD-dependent epimerase/dehydratase family protein [Bacteroidota bacterium]
MKESVLVIGAKGQIGSELVEELRRIYGDSNVIATDIKMPSEGFLDSGPFYQLDVLDFVKVSEIIRKHNVKQVYLLAALLSATAEQKVKSAWRLNMEGLLGTLELAREEKFKLFWPSSIAVFGPNTPRVNTPQFTVTEPSTVYGISKLAGERWCEYYFQKFNVDVRSIRYPGLIGYKSEPGGGTTDYAVHIFHEAIKNKTYECFLSENTELPMMYMHDALRATIGLMDAPAEQVKIRSSYNVSAISFTPKQLAAEIRKHIPDFTITYKPDVRQQYADSWPKSIDDAEARKDWNWKPEFDLSSMTEDMLQHIQAMVQHH